MLRAVPAATTYQKPGLKTGRSHQIRLIRTTFVHIQCKAPDGNPLKDHPYVLELPDGDVIRDKLDADGICHHDGVLPGECKFQLIVEREGEPYTGEPKPEQKKTHTIKLRLEDEDGTPFANCRYQLLVGEQTYDGRTTDKGVIVHDVPTDAESGELHFWADDEPDAEEMVWPLRVRDHLAR